MINDVDMFFGSELAIDARYTADEDTQEAVIPVIFDRAGTISVLRGAAVQNTMDTIRVRTSDVHGASPKSTLVIDDATYYVMRVYPEGDGLITVLELSKDNPRA